MTTEQLAELKAAILHFRDLAGYYAPPHALTELNEAWTPIAALLGEIDDADLRARMTDGQLELWGAV